MFIFSRSFALEAIEIASTGSNKTLRISVASVNAYSVVLI